MASSVNPGGAFLLLTNPIDFIYLVPMAKNKKRTVSSKRKPENNNRLLIILGTILVLIIVIFGVFVIYYSTEPKPDTHILTEEDLIPKKPDHIEFKKQGELAFLSEKNDTIKQIEIEVVRTIYEQQLGMMYRDSLADNHGMLFLSSNEEVRSFWMKNTRVSLDIIFVNSDKKIVKIHKNAKPLSEQQYNSEKPARYVVEVRAGFTDHYGIKEGDKISLLIF